MKSWRLLVLAAWLASPVAAQGVPETDCDRLAGFDHTPRVPGLIGAYVVSDAAGAVAACETALIMYPEDPFFNLLLARALLTLDPEEPRALQLTQAAAAAFPAFATGRLGWLLQNGYAGLAANPTSARAAYQAACALRPDPHAAVACNNLAMMMLDGQGGAADPATALALLDGVCSEGLTMACVNLGFELEVGRATEIDTGRAAALYAGACDRGDLMGCNNLGYLHETAQGVAGDMVQALALYGRACEGGEMLGCTNLGEAYRTGNGVAADGPLAEGYYQRACDAHDAYACFALGQMFSEGEGLPADPARALTLFDRACDLGDPESCDVAAGMK